MNRFKQLLSALFLGANLCCLAALWLCCLSTWVSPGRFPTISVMGLMFPVVLSINIAFLIFWLIFRVRYTLVPLIGMLLVGSYIYDYCPVRLKSTPEGGETLTVVTFNACGIQSDSAKAAFTEYVRQVQPDILCLQEFPHSWFWREDAKALMQEMNYSHVGATDNHIMTRLAILGDTIHIAYPTRKNSSIACWVGRDGDSILVVNNHLESNQLNDEDKKEYRDMFKDPHRQTVKESSLNLFRKLSQAAVYRSAQTDVLSHIADSLSPRPIIMAGDFNDTPISYTYQKLSRRLHSVYRQSGSGFGRSFNQSGFPVRIDHIFTSNHWTSSGTYIDQEFDVSDHYPLVTRLHRR